MPSAGGCEEAAAGPSEEAPAASPAAPPRPPGPPRGRLCGYLGRLSGKGPLRGFRSRWFVFEPGRCALYYFKGPQEALPLGRLDIARAAFTLHRHDDDPAAAAAPHAPQGLPDGGPGTAFEIHSPGGAVTVLKAASCVEVASFELFKSVPEMTTKCGNLAVLTAEIPSGTALAFMDNEDLPSAMGIKATGMQRSQKASRPDTDKPSSASARRLPPVPVGQPFGVGAF
ncbi:UNVERIFIED_CONTAM: hypothetical protein K2H54_006124 [Gekko kuhli]